MADVQFTDHSDRLKIKFEKALKKAATMIGGTIEGHAKELAPVDTGLLRNSITYAIGGEPPAIQSYRADKGDGRGEYAGTAPTDDEQEVTVYIGTNVQYAPYQELGAPNINLPARAFLRPAFENSKNEIEQVIRQCFEDLN